MTDIETRLRADAARTTLPPDFDTALATATERRPRAYGWLAAAAAVLIVGGASAAFTLTSHQGSTPLTAPASTATIVGAVVAPYSKAPQQVMVLLELPSPPPGQCGKARVLLRESATDIRVTASVQWVDDRVTLVPGRSVVIAPSGTQTTLAPERLAPVRNPLCRSSTAIVTGLKQPLNSRPMIDENTGAPIEVFTGPVPTPDYVPDTYVPWGPNYQDPMSSTTLDTRPGALGPLTLSWGARNSVGARLEVVDAPSDTVNPGAQVIDHVTVDEHDAAVTQTPETRCITWASDSGDGVQVCSDIKDAPTTQLLSEDELLRVARSLNS